MNIMIRDEQPEDIESIETLTRAAFLNAEHTSHTEQFIVNNLRKSGQLTIEPYRDCRRHIFLRECRYDKIKIHRRNQRTSSTFAA